MTIKRYERVINGDDPQRCTYCGELLVIGYIYWSAQDEYGDISLSIMHVECEKDFNDSGAESYLPYINKRPVFKQRQKYGMFRRLINRIREACQ